MSTTTLEQSLIEIINLTKDSIKAGSSFISQQIPDVIQQLLYWKFIENLVMAIIGVLLPLIFLFIAKKVYQYAEERHKKYSYSDALMGFWVGTVSCGLIIVILSSMAINLTWLQILVAPKLYLIEYVAQLAK